MAGETEIAQFMKKLVDIDKDWPDRPDAEPRRLLEVPWVHDFTPDSSIIAPMFVQGNESPLIFIDEQSKRDDTALLLWCNEEKKDHCTLRVPIKRANLLLSAAAEGKIVLEGEEFQPVGYDVPAIMKQGQQREKETYPIFIIAPMTPEEIERMKSYAEERMVDYSEYTEWFYVADKLESPDMKGLTAWFESPQCDFKEPPFYFMAVDRWSLEIANDEEEITDTWAECIVASDQGAEYVLEGDNGYPYVSWRGGFGYDRNSFEEGTEICMALEQANERFMELFRGAEFVYWKEFQSWADKTPNPRCEGFEFPEGRAYWPSVDWDE
ncbi:hypothetical protein VI817_005983 [Penicillium citrinum]|nr:hypothetical protein VI817_005983 [Penicillium citrinum]